MEIKQADKRSQQ